MAALLMAASGAVLACSLPRVYTARVDIVVDPRPVRQQGGAAAPAGPAPEASFGVIDSEARRLRSVPVLRSVVERQHLAEDPEFDGEPQNAAGAAFRAIHDAVFGSAPADKAAVALDRLTERVRVRRAAGSNILDLSVSSRDPAKAARLAEAVTEVFIAAQERPVEAPPIQVPARQPTKTISPNRAVRLDALKADLDRAEAAVGAFRRQNGLADADGKPGADPRLAVLSGQLAAARARADELRTRSEQLARLWRSGRVPEAGADLVPSPLLAELLIRYADAKLRLDRLLTSLGPRHPDLIEARSQLGRLRDLVAGEIGRLAALARSQYAGAKAAEQDLSRQVDAAVRRAGAAKAALIHLRDLEREADARRLAYAAALAQAREPIDPPKSEDPPKMLEPPLSPVSVISPARPPVRPDGPPRWWLVGIAAAIGAGAAGLGVLGLDRLNGRLMTPRQFGRASGLPLLGLAGPLTRLGTGSHPPEAVAALGDVLAGIAPPAPPRVILFLSGPGAAAEAGVPVDLARALCQDGRRVLLIDGDEDRLTRSLDHGFAADRRAWPGVQRTAVPGLAILSWRVPFTALRRFDGSPGTDLFRHLAADHDFVFVHASVGRTGLRPRDLAQAATNILLIVDADGASASGARAMRDAVGPFGSKLAGFVWVEGGRSPPSHPSPKLPRPEARRAGSG